MSLNNSGRVSQLRRLFSLCHCMLDIVDISCTAIKKGTAVPWCHGRKRTSDIWLPLSSKKYPENPSCCKDRKHMTKRQGTQVLFQSWVGVFRTVGFSGQWGLGSGHMMFAPCINQLITLMLYSGYLLNVKAFLSKHQDRKLCTFRKKRWLKVR